MNRRSSIWPKNGKWIHGDVKTLKGVVGGGKLKSTLHRLHYLKKIIK